MQQRPTSPPVTQPDLPGDDLLAWIAAAKSGDLFMLKALYAQSSSKSALCSHCAARDQTACHLLADGGHSACLQWLLSLPEHVVNGLNNDGKRTTPLHLAAANGHTACVELLLAAGFNAAARDAKGDTAFACAAARAHASAARALQAVMPAMPPHAMLQLSIGGRRAGCLIFRLDEGRAPRACANFLGLCEGFRAS